MFDAVLSSIVPSESLAYDPSAGYVVRFGGFLDNFASSATWEFRAGEWTNVTSAAQPPGRGYGAMAYDYADGYLVLFGGLGYSSGTGPHLLGDTWAFANGQWSELVETSGPPALAFGSFAYDPALAGVVLFGGENGTGAINETWLFRGGAWTRLVPTATAPQGRIGAAVAWDAASSEILMFGGDALATRGANLTMVPLTDTWTFNGSDWARSTPTHAPPAAAFDALAMTNDTRAGNLLLYELPNGTSPTRSESWTFSGGDWSQLNLSVQSSPVVLAGIAFDGSADEVILYGDASTGDLFSTAQTWGFNGSSWTLLDNLTYPGPLFGPATAYDSSDGQIFEFGGQTASANLENQTYRFDGVLWHGVSSPVAPPARSLGQMIYDPTLGGLVLFGGANDTSVLGDTWQFVHGIWSESGNGTDGPPARIGASFSYDSATNEAVLFGGFNESGVALNDTWTYNASGWSELHLTTSPSARAGAAMTFDPDRNGLILFGGSSNSAGYTPSQDTWAFNGTAWIDLTLNVSPLPRSEAALSFDPALSGDLLYGGGNGTAALSDTWLLTRAGWERLPTPQSPSARAAAGLYFDTPTGAAWLVFGYAPVNGGTAVELYSDAWVFDAMSLVATDNVTTGPAPLPVGFTATTLFGVQPYSYRWSFGDGNTATEADVDHAYDRGGTYDANISVTDDIGLEVEQTFSVVAVGGGVAPFTVEVNVTPTSGVAPLEVEVTAEAKGGEAPYSYAWTFGDGGSLFTANGSHVYTTAGGFPAQLAVTDSLKSMIYDTVDINVSWPTTPPPPPPPTPPPTPIIWTAGNLSISLTPAHGPLPLNVTFAAQESGAYGNVTYDWTFGDGATGVGASVHHVFDEVGTFEVTLIGRDSIGETAEAYANVTVTPATPSGASLGRTVPTVDLLALVALSAGILVLVAMWAGRVGRRRAAPPASAVAGSESPAPPADDTEPPESPPGNAG